MLDVTRGLLYVIHLPFHITHTTFCPKCESVVLLWRSYVHLALSCLKESSLDQSMNCSNTWISLPEDLKITHPILSFDSLEAFDDIITVDDDIGLHRLMTICLS